LAVAQKFAQPVAIIHCREKTHKTQKNAKNTGNGYVGRQILRGGASAGQVHEHRFIYMDEQDMQDDVMRLYPSGDPC